MPILAFAHVFAAAVSSLHGLGPWIDALACHVYPYC